MIIIVKKEENDYTAAWKNNEGVETSFSYIELVDCLSKEIPIELSFENVEEEDKRSISNLFSEIKTKIDTTIIAIKSSDEDGK